MGLPRRQHHGHHQLVPPGGGRDFPFVALYHRLGDGQADAIAPLLGTAGLVPPVEPVEHVLQQLLAQGLGGVGHGEEERLPLPGQGYRNLAPRRGILQGVVQQDGHQLSQALLLPHQGEGGLDAQGEGFSLALGHGLEGLGGLRHQVREGQGEEGGLPLGLLHPGEVDEVVGEGGQPPNLVLDVIDPLIALPGLQGQHVGVCLDDGNGGFQLVTGVGDEPLLLFVALQNGADDPPGEEEQQEKHCQQPHRRHPKPCKQRGSESEQVAAVVQENDPGLIPLLGGQIPVVLEKPPGMPLVPHLLGIGLRRLLVHSGNLPQVGGGHVAALVQKDGEVTDLIPQLRGAAAGALLLPVEIRRQGRKGPLPLGQQVQNTVRVGDNPPVTVQEDRPQNHHKHHQQGEHGRRHQPGTEGSDHEISSKE